MNHYFLFNEPLFFVQIKFLPHQLLGDNWYLKKPTMVYNLGTLHNNVRRFNWQISIPCSFKTSYSHQQTDCSGRKLFVINRLQFQISTNVPVHRARTAANAATSRMNIVVRAYVASRAAPARPVGGATRYRLCETVMCNAMSSNCVCGA